MALLGGIVMLLMVILCFLNGCPGLAMIALILMLLDE